MTHGFSHLDPLGRARMVDVTPKEPTHRRAMARARITMKAETASAVARGAIGKGDVLAVARVAGIQAAKRTSELIPLCHPTALTGAEIAMSFESPPGDEAAATVEIRATIHAFDRTGVEMEALVAASTAALTIYDMLKAIDRWMTITDVRLIEKSGGRSGHLHRADP